jgi:predicted aldo/keto reductase-like oxidoreductase
MDQVIVPRRALGRTGQKVSALGLGGWHLSLKHVDEKLADRIMRSAVDRGIDFFDNSWDYNGGESERRMGKTLSDGYREKVFLMTKINGRTKKEAMRQLEESLKRLRVDAALEEAKAQGKIRFIGFTGHKDPRVHLYMLEVAAQNGFHFDSAQMPLNVMDAHFRSFSKLVVPELVKQQIAVLAMKTMANGQILDSKTVTPIECLHYALNLETSVVITGIDSMEILDQAFEAVRTFHPMNAEEVNAILSKTKTAAERGKFELFKTTSIYDGTAQHPEWLGEEPEHVRAVMRS